MTEDEKKVKRKEYMRKYHRAWRKRNPEKEGEYRRRMWEKKLKQEEQEEQNKNEEEGEKGV